MDARETLRRQLELSQRLLQVLEEQAAGYTVLTIPAHLRIELEEKRREVQGLKSRLAQLEGRPTAGLPNNLPPRPPVFVGREREIARCLEALSSEDRGWGVLIDGQGGIGKTALALEVAYRARAQAWFDAYLYASAKTTWLSPEGIREETLALTSLDTFTRTFAREIGAPEVAQMNDAAARTQALLGVLRGRRALLIWDNLETLTREEQERIAAFLRRLPAPSKAIVTSRYRVGESAAIVRLDGLAEAEAFRLMDALGRRSPKVARELQRVGEAGRRALYDLTGGNPLALHWALGLIDVKGYPFEQALQSLRDGARAGDLYRFLFAEAVTELTADAQAVLSSLAAFRTPATPATLAEVTERSEVEVRAALTRLVGLSLVHDLENDRYGLHPLTRAFVHTALEGNGDLPGGDPEAYRRTLTHWVDYAQKSMAETTKKHTAPLTAWRPHGQTWRPQPWPCGNAPAYPARCGTKTGHAPWWNWPTPSGTSFSSTATGTRGST